MPIDEAIERLSRTDFLFWQSEREEDMAALRLGIEALEEVKCSRICSPNGICSLLLGETEIDPLP